jgi:putative ABC transport system permease protein
MSFLQILLRSMARHRLSTLLALLSTMLGVALLIAVVSFREQSHRRFVTEGTGVDAILGPKGSALQIVLNALYHLDEMPGTVKWTYYEKVRRNPLVVDAIPFATGHSFAGFRVNAIDDRFFTTFEYRPGKRFSFLPEEGGQGRAFAQGREAVAGWAAARALHLTLGSAFNPVHGVHSGDPVHIHDTFHFVGIMAPTGTPHDLAIYIPLNAFYTLEGHGAAVARMAIDPTHREISGAYLRLRRIRGGAMHPGVQELKYEINQSPDAQLVVPNEVIPQILNIIGWADRVIFLLGAMVVGLGVAFLFVVLVTALREQRRDLAMLRMLGANRGTVFGLILSEALLLSAAGTLCGLAAGHELVSVGSQYVARETGMLFSAQYISTADIWVLPIMLLLGAIAGLLPALQAYRLNVLENLRALE